MKSVLIIGAASPNRRTFLSILGRHGWWVDVAESPEDALRFLDQSPRRVIVVDWHIAGGSGLALVQAIKLEAAWQSTPIVMMYDDVSVADLEHAFALGVNDFLGSPFTPEAALRKVERWVLDYGGPAETLHTRI